jgi:hypothetical protein
VNVVDVATPTELVVSVSVAVPFSKVPLAPLDGAVKVTETPPVGVPPVVTVATSGAANTVLTAAVCGVPLVAVMVSTGTGKFVKLKLAGDEAPGAEALTV